MIRIPGASTWTTGKYTIYASSNTVIKEWQDLERRRPDDARRCYERLVSFPLHPLGARQFPLKGKKNKGFWQYEVGSGDRVHYRIAMNATNVIVVAAGKHPRSGVSLGKQLKKRRK